MPVCQRRITLGDGETYFKATMDQAGSLNSQASGSGRAPSRRTSALLGASAACAGPRSHARFTRHG